LSTLSHGVLDAIILGGKGVGFFSPFKIQDIFFSFRGIKVSPIGMGFFFLEWGINVVLTELKYIEIPRVIILTTMYTKRRTCNCVS
jgi:inner membrane protein